MEIEFRLKKILEENAISTHGAIQEIAEHCNVNRQTIGRLLRNETNCISLELVGKICDWLEKKKHLTSRNIPQALIGRRPAELWEAVARSNSSLFCLGQFEQGKPEDLTMKYIARCDAYMENQIRMYLSRHYPKLNQLETCYVPFRVEYRRDNKTLTPQLSEDIQNAKSVFDDIQEQKKKTAMIYVGSMITNYCTEIAVAKAFKCEPFVKSAPLGSGIPFYVQYRSRDHAVRSCFGGLKRPAGFPGRTNHKGIYYRDKNDKWEVLQWVQGQYDLAIVMVVYDMNQTVSLQVLAMGYSGIATEHLGRLLASEFANNFWHSSMPKGGIQAGVYLCKMDLEKIPQNVSSVQSLRDATSVIALDPNIIRKYQRHTE